MEGVADQKIAEIRGFERSDLYDEAERAALRFARDASLGPNEFDGPRAEGGDLPTPRSAARAFSSSGRSRGLAERGGGWLASAWGW